MSPGEKRDALWAAGWHQPCRWRPKGEKRAPERWHAPDDVLYERPLTLGQAYLECAQRTAASS